MSWYDNVNSATPLGKAIGKWLIQGINGLDANQQSLMQQDLQSVMDPFGDNQFAINEGVAFAQQRQDGRLTWQQEAIIQDIMNTSPNNPVNELENTGSENAQM